MVLREILSLFCTAQTICHLQDFLCFQYNNSTVSIHVEDNNIASKKFTKDIAVDLFKQCIELGPLIVENCYVMNGNLYKVYTNHNLCF